MISQDLPLWVCECGRSVTHLQEVADQKLCHLCGGVLRLKEDVVKQTSLLAFISLDEDKLSARRKLILDEFKRGPGTDCEVMQRLGFKDPNKVRPRRKELLDMGFLSANDKRICKVTGETVTEWVYNVRS